MHRRELASQWTKPRLFRSQQGEPQCSRGRADVFPHACWHIGKPVLAGWLTVLNSSYTFLSCSVNFGLSCPDTSWRYAVTSACGAEQCALLVPVSICSLRGPLGWSVCWRCQNAWVQDLDLACAMRLVYKSNSLMPSHNCDFQVHLSFPPTFF